MRERTAEHLLDLDATQAEMADLAARGRAVVECHAADLHSSLGDEIGHARALLDASD